MLELVYLAMPLLFECDDYSFSEVKSLIYLFSAEDDRDLESEGSQGVIVSSTKH